MLLEERVDEASKCLPAKTSRSEESGRFVLSARRDRSVEIEVVDGTLSGIMLPAMFLTKIWMVSSLEEVVEDWEVMLLDREEGRMVAEM